MRSAIAILGVLLGACSVGTGHGEVRGSVRDDACRLDRPEYDLAPDFFVAEVIEDWGLPGTDQRGALTIRIQRGSYRESDSDGILVYVPDANELHASSLGVPIPVDAAADAPVQMTLYLGQSCDSGFPRSEYWQIPTVLEAYAGTITFDAIYAPDVDPANAEITARFENVVFLDPTRADRIATLSGNFSFQYQRGRPAQRFPY